MNELMLNYNIARNVEILRKEIKVFSNLLDIIRIASDKEGVSFKKMSKKDIDFIIEVIKIRNSEDYFFIEKKKKAVFELRDCSIIYPITAMLKKFKPE